MVAWSWLELRAGCGRMLANRRVRVALAVTFLAAQGVGLVVMHPCQLSYYNLLVGGLHGANRLGFERTYWGDSLTRSLLSKVAASVPEGATIAVSPVLHQFQLDELLMQSPILRARRIRLVPTAWVRGNPKVRIAGELVFCRKADLLPQDIVGEPDQELSEIAHVGSGASWLAVLRRPRPEFSDGTHEK